MAVHGEFAYESASSNSSAVGWCCHTATAVIAPSQVVSKLR